MAKRSNTNIKIKSKEVRLIGPDGKQIGVVSTIKAMEIADSYELDLVEVSPTANPPVCKVMDYGRFKYEQQKKQQEAKKKQSTFQIKEIKVRPKTSDHDLEVKISHIKRFIEDKDKVKVTVMFRGREITLATQAKEILQKIQNAITDIAIIEFAPKMEGRSLYMLVAPK